jgi:hypothetical protein
MNSDARLRGRDVSKDNADRWVPVLEWKLFAVDVGDLHFDGRLTDDGNVSFKLSCPKSEDGSWDVTRLKPVEEHIFCKVIVHSTSSPASTAESVQHTETMRFDMDNEL